MKHRQGIVDELLSYGLTEEQAGEVFDSNDEMALGTILSFLEQYGESIIC